MVFVYLRCRLQNVVIDIEVSASTPSPTVDPSVRTILIGHSMGGIVAADALLSITSDAPIPPPPSSTSTTASSGGFETKATPPKFHEASLSSDDSSTGGTFMFPYIQGILAFDTPYLGISPSVIAHGAESQYKTASSAFSALGEVASAFGWGGAGGAAAAASSKSSAPAPPQQQKALPAPPDSARNAMAASMRAKTSDDAAAVPTWQRWGKYAMFAGAAGAVAAGGAAAYLKRDSITEGWTWVGSHLEFVGCLMRGEELKSRLDRVMRLRVDKGVGFKDLITVLGKGSSGGRPPAMTMAGGFVEVHRSGGSPERTFCNVPKSERKKGEVFERLEIEEARDEMEAHCSIFLPGEHRGYYGMSERAKELVVKWVERGWYESSEVAMGGGKGEREGQGEGSWALGGEEAVLVSLLDEREGIMKC